MAAGAVGDAQPAQLQVRPVANVNGVHQRPHVQHCLSPIGLVCREASLLNIPHKARLRQQGSIGWLQV